MIEICKECGQERLDKMNFWESWGHIILTVIITILGYALIMSIIFKIKYGKWLFW